MIGVLLQRLRGRLDREVRIRVFDRQQRHHDQQRGTQTTEHGGRLSPRLKSFSWQAGDLDVPAYARLLEGHLAHRFDLLGGKNLDVGYAAISPGTEGHAYPPASWPTVDAEGDWLTARLAGPDLAFGRRCWQLIEGPYAPIDWQRDTKSGFRWSESLWYRDLRSVTAPGADLKVPWELARGQHLVQLAVGHGLARADVDGPWPLPDLLVQEFRNQVLDFIANNPPRFGVNWTCPMDVAIRVANWLVAWDLFQAAGVEFDDPFTEAFTASIISHGHHVFTNLERTGERRNNHYLADIVGLVFAGTWLEDCPQADRWLALAAPALITEADHQFHPEGSSREGSTCYHRLCSEMVALGMAAVVGSPRGGEHLARHDGGFPDATWQRLAGMGDFTRGVMRPDGRLHQIGDNDSGRFLDLVPDFSLPAAQRSLAGGDLLTTLSALLTTGLDATGDERFRLQHEFVIALAGHHVHQTSIKTPPLVAPPPGQGAESSREEAATNLRLEFPGEDLQSDLTMTPFPGFGLYVYRSPRLHLVIRCGRVTGNWVHSLGHHHGDQLSMALNVDGVDLIEDPGTYLYTAAPERRNEYRSPGSHFGPRIEASTERQMLGHGLFNLGASPQGECLLATPRRFVGKLLVEGEDRGRLHIGIEAGAITVQSFGFRYGSRQNLPVSSGYGQRDEQRLAVADPIWRAVSDQDVKTKPIVFSEQR